MSVNFELNNAFFDYMSSDMETNIKNLLRHINSNECSNSSLNNSLYKLVSNYSNDNYNKLLEYYSKEKIKQMIPPTVIEKKEELSDKLYKLLEQGNVESSNIEMLMMLIEAKKLPISILENIEIESKLNKNAEKDLEKLFLAYSEGKDIKEYFVPRYENEEEAIREIEVGDVCEIKDSKNIHIKMQNNTLKELSISPDTYMSLFPPIERFGLIQGSLQSDCYIVAIIDSIFQNPNTRYFILQLFKEQEDGSVNIEFSEETGQEVNFVLKDIETLLNNKKYINYTTNTCEGFRGLELLFEEYSKSENEKEIDNQYEIFKSLLEDNNDYIYIDDYKYIKEEMEIFLKIVDTYKKDKNNFHKKLLSNKHTYTGQAVINNDNNSNDDKEYKFYKDETLKKYFNLILDRYNNYLYKNNIYSTEFAEILPIEIYTEIINKKGEKNPFIFISDGGCTEEVYNTLGIKYSIMSFEQDSSLINEILNKPISELRNSIFTIDNLSFFS